MKKNKSVIKNIIFIIINYLFFTCLINLRFLISNILKHSDQYSLNLLSATAILSTIIISILYIFRKEILKKSYYFWTIYAFLIIMAFVEAYKIQFIAYPFILLILYLMLTTFFTMYLSKMKFELSMVTSVSIIIISTFILGLLGLLALVKYLVLASSIFIICYLYRERKKNKKKLSETKDNFFKNGFLVFIVIYIIVILGGSGMYVNCYDEYSHWAFDAKSMIYYSKIGNSQISMLKTRGYPPMFSVWHYFVSVFGKYSEPTLYIGLNLLTGIYLLPAFTLMENKRFLTKILSFIAIFFCCFLFGGVYIYASLYVDLLISVIFSSLLIMHFILESKNIDCKLPLILSLVIITLSKTNGFEIAFVFMFMVILNEILSKKVKFKDIRKLIFDLVKKYYKYVLVIIVTFLVWKIYFVITEKITYDYYNSVIMPDILKTDLKPKLNGYFIKSYLKKVMESFNSTLIHGNINISLWQYLVILFSSFFAAFYVSEKKDVPKALKKTFVFVSGYIMFFAATVLAIFYSFSMYETSNLASFGRYLNWYHVGALIFILSYLLTFDLNKKDFKLNIFYIFVIILIPFSGMTYFIYNPLNQGSYENSLKYNEKVKVIKKYVPDNSMVYIIDQKDKEGIMAMWHVRFYAFPIQTNASSLSISWKIKTDKNEEDLNDWGLTAKKWEKELIKYKFKYVYLFSSDKEFFKETEYMYDNYEKAKKSTLFKVKVSNNRVTLAPIK